LIVAVTLIGIGTELWHRVGTPKIDGKSGIQATSVPRLELI